MRLVRCDQGPLFCQALRTSYRSLSYRLSAVSVIVKTTKIVRSNATAAQFRT